MQKGCVFMSMGLFFDTLLTAYLSRGIMLLTAILLVFSAFVFFSRKTPKKRRIFCGVVVIYCIFYFIVIFALSFLFSLNHGPAQTVPGHIAQGDLTVVAPLFGQEVQHHEAQTVPEGFIEEGGMEIPGQLRNGVVKAHPQEAFGFRAEGLPVEEVAPAADALADEEAQRH